MSARLPEQDALTPQARVDAAGRRLLGAIAELVAAHVSRNSALSEWVSQEDSPLGRDRHLRLCRKKILPSVKDGRKRLVRRSDIDAYLLRNQLAQPPAAEDDVTAMMRKLVGGRR